MKAIYQSFRAAVLSPSLFLLFDYTTLSFSYSFLLYLTCVLRCTPGGRLSAAPVLCCVWATCSASTGSGTACAPTTPCLKSIRRTLGGEQARQGPSLKSNGSGRGRGRMLISTVAGVASSGRFLLSAVQSVSCNNHQESRVRDPPLPEAWLLL